MRICKRTGSNHSKHTNKHQRRQHQQLLQHFDHTKYLYNILSSELAKTNLKWTGHIKQTNQQNQRTQTERSRFESVDVLKLEKYFFLVFC